MSAEFQLYPPHDTCVLAQLRKYGKFQLALGTARKQLLSNFAKQEVYYQRPQSFSWTGT